MYRKYIDYIGPVRLLWLMSVESYNECDFYLNSNFLTISAAEFYQNLFRNYFQIEVKKDKKKLEKEKGKGNGIVVYFDNELQKMKTRLIFNDFKILKNKKIIDSDLAFVSPISYFGRNRTLKNAHELFAMTFDLDGVGKNEITDLFFQMSNDILPTPNYVVNSGNGLHLYYVFEKPIFMYQNNIKELNKIKYSLTKKIWNKYTSTIKEKQFQNINQGFRVVGSSVKFNKNLKAKVFDLDNKFIDIDYLNSFVYEEKVKVANLKSKISLSEAKEKYPDWYEKRILKKEKKGSWTNNKALYYWWLEKIKLGATEGHRYFCIFTLMIYAVKSGISKDILKKDAYSLLNDFDKLSSNNDNRFTQKDIDDALRLYNVRFKNYSISEIIRITGISIERNKRNFRTREQHLQIARATRDILYEDWRANNGRKSKKDLVLDWKLKNPGKRKIDCFRDLKVSRTTIDKYW